MSMNDDNACPSRSEPFESSKSACPCCFFIRPNLFLPQEQREWKAISEELKNSSIADKRHSILSSILDPREAKAIILVETIENLSSSACSTYKMVDTHGHPHLNRDRLTEYVANESSRGDFSFLSTGSMMSITCAVEEADWNDALEYASASPYILPALGVHPWYLHNLSSGWLERLESLLLQHPSALVGEIGLCKMARNLRTEGNKDFALQRQRKAFSDQMYLAAKLRRPVSVHCVKQHRVLLEILEEIRQRATEEFQRRVNEVPSPPNTTAEDDRKRFITQALPPTVAMHSFTGTAQHVKDLLSFEESLIAPSKQPRKKKHPCKASNSRNDGDPPQAYLQKGQKETTDTSSPTLIYFGFSHSINVLMCSSDKSKCQVYEAIQSIPLNRILAESDVHAPLDVAAGTAGAIALIADALQMPLTEIARVTTRNAMEFLSSIH
jgi:Tat protein secretion system quality control protein TatD with DNase activity